MSDETEGFRFQVSSFTRAGRMKKDAAIDKEAAATLRALRRAARRARELGEKTGTPVYVMKNNRIVDLNPRSLRQSRSKSSQKRRAA